MIIISSKQHLLHVHEREHTRTYKTNEAEENKKWTARYDKCNNEVREAGLYGSGAEQQCDDACNTGYHTTESLKHATQLSINI